jgi:hypothetical protein
MAQQDPPAKTTGSDRNNVLIKAENGDVIRYDDTGLLLRLSDRVLEDIVVRLRERGLLTTEYFSDDSALSPTEDTEHEIPQGIDAWSISQNGAWTRFTANLAGKSGPRGFMCKGSNGAIVADTPTPLFGLFAIGGPRASLACDRTPDFPHHVVSSGDDIGAVGRDGEGDAQPVSDVHLLRELTHEALVAEVLLSHALAHRDALPLFFARAETDGSTNAADLAKGPAFENLTQAARNLKSCATDLGKRANLMGVFLDFALEDVQSTPEAYRDAMIALMENITRSFAQDGIPAPPFYAFFECGTQDIAADSALEGQWELAWNNAGHNLSIVAPTYMLALDANARLNTQQMVLRAAMSAEAIAFVQAGERWFCPTLQLAEHDGALIKVTAKCHGELMLDSADPFSSGKNFGFSLEGVAEGIEIKSVAVDPKDKKSLVVICNRPVTGPNPTLRYASGQAPRLDIGYPANCGALRDKFEAQLHHESLGDDAALLRRWALPARLKIT